MKTVIYKSLIYRDNSLFLKGVALFKLPEPNNSLQEYSLNQDILKLKNSLQKMDKKYINDCKEVIVNRENDYVNVTLKCENDADHYTRTYGFFLYTNSFQFVA